MISFGNPSAIHRILRALAWVGLIGFTQGCAIFYQPPVVEIVGVEVVSLGLSSGTVEVALEVTNESGRQMNIRGFLYEIEVKGPDDGAKWATLAEGFFDRALVIPGREMQKVRVPVPFEYAVLGDVIRSLLSSGEVPYRLKGEIWLGGSKLGLQIPFRHEGVLKP